MGDKLVLVALNAKYCHTSLSVRSLKGYFAVHGLQIPIVEFTINDRVQEIVRRLYELDKNVYAFSCYIWNIGIVTQICRELKTLRPEIKIWLGGPEVSFDPESYDFADKVFCGEGETAMLRVLRGGENGKVVRGEPLSDLDSLPFLYPDIDAVSDRLVYYESSRGCPFNCSYCLSSADKGVRYRSLDKVFEDIMRFENSGVSLVKFVDRTFNADRERANAIWSFINKNCKHTAFHFEVEGELLDEKQLELLKSFRKGAIQLEIGVQSTNQQTLEAVNRRSDIPKLLDIIRRLSENDNIHIHADLIAGMPHEGYERFAKSFDELYSARPHCIQLGFLKLLKGSAMRESSVRWNYKFSQNAPYTVLSNDFISYSEINKLRDVEYLVDKLYDSGCFEASLDYETMRFGSPFSYFEKLSEYMRKSGYYDRPLSRKFLYQVMWEFSCENDELKKFLWLDYLCANGRPAPLFLGGDKLVDVPGYRDKYRKVIAMFNINKR